LTISIPIWVRVPGIITLVLIGMLISSTTMPVDADRGSGGDHGSGDEMEMDGGDQGRSGHETETDSGGSPTPRLEATPTGGAGDETGTDGGGHGSGDDGGHDSGDEMETDGGDHGSG